MEWEVQFSEHVQLAEVMSVAKDSISEAAAAAGVVVVLVASNKSDKLNALLQGCAAAERSSVSRRPTLLPAYNTSVDTLAVASYETRRRSTVGSDVVVWRNEIDTLLQLVQGLARHIRASATVCSSLQSALNVVLSQMQSVSCGCDIKATTMRHLLFFELVLLFITHVRAFLASQRSTLHHVYARVALCRHGLSYNRPGQ
eukprot:3249-Heterococcus_DN1.PRE.2